jgi:hypothetical protein
MAEKSKASSAENSRSHIKTTRPADAGPYLVRTSLLCTIIDRNSSSASAERLLSQTWLRSLSPIYIRRESSGPGRLELPEELLSVARPTTISTHPPPPQTIQCPLFVLVGPPCTRRCVPARLPSWCGSLCAFRRSRDLPGLGSYLALSKS